MTTLTLAKVVLGAAATLALLGGCNKHPADQPAAPESGTTPAATPPADAAPPAASTPPAQGDGTTPPPPATK